MIELKYYIYNLKNETQAPVYQVLNPASAINQNCNPTSLVKVSI